MAGTLLSPNLLLQMRAWCKVGNQVSVTTFHHLVQSIDSGAPDDEDFLLHWEAIYGGIFKGLIANGVNYVGSTAQIITPPIGLLRKNNITAGPGTGGTNTNATQVSGLIQWGTNLGGRKFRGRVFMPFPSEEENGVDGKPVAGYLIGLDGLGDEYVHHTNWIMTLGHATIVPVIRHRKDKTGVTSAPTQITTYTSVPNWATQKKRGAFGRPNISPF